MFGNFVKRQVRKGRLAPGTRKAESVAFFKEEDTKRAEDEVKAWKAKYPEAAKELAELWKKNVPTAGHKTMAREVVKSETVS